MTIDDKIRDEKLQYREAAKISALSSGKIDEYEYLTCEEILPPVQSQIIEHAKFTYFPLGKAFEKQTNKQADALKSLNLSHKIGELKQIEIVFPKNQLNDFIIDKLKEIIQLQDNIKVDHLEYTTKGGKHYNFSK